MTKNINRYLLAVLFIVGYLWLKSGYGKVSGGIFVDGLGKTLITFASKNPYPWYKDFLNNFAIPNSQIFGNLTMCGEVLTGIALVLGSTFLLIKGSNKLVVGGMIAGLMGGIFLNIIFWLASSWTSASTDSINLLMFSVQLVGLVYSIKLLKN